MPKTPPLIQPDASNYKEMHEPGPPPRILRAALVEGPAHLSSSHFGHNAGAVTTIGLPLPATLLLAALCTTGDTLENEELNAVIDLAHERS